VGVVHQSAFGARAEGLPEEDGSVLLGPEPPGAAEVQGGGVIDVPLAVERAIEERGVSPEWEAGADWRSGSLSQGRKGKAKQDGGAHGGSLR
jgi:hypothetical protein